MWTPQHKGQQRTGWRRVPLGVRGREVRVLVKVEGLCRRVGWGARVFFVIVVRGHSKRTKQGKSRAPMAFWVHAVSDDKGGWRLPVSLEGLLLKLWQRWEIEVGFRWLKSGFGLGEKPCWGLDSGERSVAWSAWVYGALVWSGYRAWGGWTGGARWGGGPCVRWSFRDVLWGARCGLVLGCGCGVELVVCVSVMRFLGGFVPLGGVFQVLLGGLLGVFGACEVRSRLLEMAVFRVPPACRGNLKEGSRKNCRAMSR